MKARGVKAKGVGGEVDPRSPFFLRKKPEVSADPKGNREQRRLWEKLYGKQQVAEEADG